MGNFFGTQCIHKAETGNKLISQLIKMTANSNCNQLVLLIFSLIHIQTDNHLILNEILQLSA